MTFAMSHANQAVMSGVPVPVVSRMLCHSNVRTTGRYAHLAEDSIHETAERFADGIAADIV